MRRLPMRKIADALRLNAGQSTVSEYLKRAERAGLSWPLPDGMDEAALEGRLFAPTGGRTRRGLAAPDWPTEDCPELYVSGPVHAVSDTQASKRSPNSMAN